jgi:hypothetical protein
MAFSLGALTAGSPGVDQLLQMRLVRIENRWRLVLGVALAATACSALLLGISARLLPVLGAEVLHAAAAVLMPAIAVVTLATCGHDKFGERLGRNVQSGSLGSAASAILLGLVASYHVRYFCSLPCCAW